MDPLPHNPIDFRGIVEADLRRAARLIIKVQDEIDWQFRIATPTGDYALSITMPNDPRDRHMMLRRLATFFAWKATQAFTLAVELVEPDAVYAVGVAAKERCNCLARITRSPLPWTAANFSAVEWLPEGRIDPAIAALLPGMLRPMTPKEISALQKWFGVAGKFPAVHVSSGEIRGL